MQSPVVVALWLFLALSVVIGHSSAELTVSSASVYGGDTSVLNTTLVNPELRGDAGTAFFANFKALQLAERINSLADQLLGDANRIPDVILMQNVPQMYIQSPASFHLVRKEFQDGRALLLAALAERLVHYEVMSERLEMDFTYPMNSETVVGGYDNFRLKSFSLILVRDVNVAAVYRTVSKQFINQPAIVNNSPAHTYGYQRIYYQTLDRPYSIINVDLTTATQHTLQVTELLSAADGADTNANVIVGGNLATFTPSSSSAFTQLTTAHGFVDSAAYQSQQTKMTCCFNSDLKTGALTTRTDYILYKGDSIEVTDYHLRGNVATDRTISNLYPSNRASVHSTIRWFGSARPRPARPGPAAPFPTLPPVEHISRTTVSDIGDNVRDVDYEYNDSYTSSSSAVPRTPGRFTPAPLSSSELESLARNQPPKPVLGSSTSAVLYEVGDNIPFFFAKPERHSDAAQLAVSMMSIVLAVIVAVVVNLA